MVIHLSCLVVGQNGESPVLLYFTFMYMFIRLYLLIIVTKY